MLINNSLFVLQLGLYNSDYGDMRHKICIWGFSCLDYSFDVPISWSHKM